MSFSIGNKVLFLNSPPGSGKDTMSDLLRGLTACKQVSFKEPMFDIAAAMVGMTRNEFLMHYNDREKKENPCEEFLGMSGRNLLISISEDFCKPKFGKDYFGKVAAKKLNYIPLGAVFSDCGFIEEVVPVAEKVGYERCVIVQFVGQGRYDFSGDSRDWVDGSSIGVKTIRLQKENLNIRPFEYAKYIIEEVNKV
jgi:hypothetical protein